MKNFLTFLIVALTLIAYSSPARAVDVTMFGPSQFSRTKGKPDSFSESFTALDKEGQISIQNGDGNGNDQVSSAEIIINGKKIFGPNDFNQNVSQLSANLDLLKQNTITVNLNSKPGSYLVVTISQDVPPPTANISVSPLTIIQGESTTLSWSSENADSCQIQPGIGDVACNDSISISPTESTTYTLTAAGLGGTISSNTSVTVYIPPTATFNVNPEAIIQGDNTTLTWTTEYADTCTIEPDVGNVDCNGSVEISPNESKTYVLTASGPGGSVTSSANIAVTIQNNGPMVSISTNPETIVTGGSAILSWNSADMDAIHIDNGIGSVASSGSLSISPSVTTTYTISGTGPDGSASSEATIHVTGNHEPQPEGSFGKQYDDLVPEDATIESYDEKRFSLITGQVKDESGLPLAGVAITIHGHANYGTAITNDEGSFTLPVEGGGVLTVVYKKEGRLTSHRQVNVGWNDYGIIETLQMIPVDTAITNVVFDGNYNNVTTHTSTQITDEFGSRSTSIVFRGNNRAFLLNEEGKDIHELKSITVRATEFNTPESMPAKLPPNSAYTYCSELQVDGAERVRFEKPVSMWVDNFLGFEVGEIVPVGYYDRDKAQWIPSDNGVVVRLLDTDNDGSVDSLDSTNDGLPNDLNNNGRFDDEVAGMTDASRYYPGSTFWRAMVKHFTPWDHNWPYGPPPGAQPPDTPPPYPNPDNPECDNSTECNSYVMHKTRAFHEDIPIPGTGLNLHYSSNRVSGYLKGTLVPATDDVIPADLKSIIVILEVAGRTYIENLSPEPNQIVEFVWDGQDQFGKYVEGVTTGKVSIGYIYDAIYYSAGDFYQAFAQAGSEATGIRARNEIILWNRSEISMQGYAEKQYPNNGWSLSNHHRLIQSKLLERGDGSSDSVSGSNFLMISAAASLPYGPGALTVDASGNIFVIGLNRINKIDTSGNITTVAGTGTVGYSGDNGLAINAKFYYPNDITVDAAGNLYIADTNNCRIRKVDNRGIITTVAGSSLCGYSGDNGPATNAKLFRPISIAVDSSGNLFISDTYNHRIRKVNTSGIITTVAGTGLTGYSGDNGPAVDAKFYYPHDITVDTAGNLFIVEPRYNSVRKVDANGIITKVAGTRFSGYSGDDGPATNAMLNFPTGIAVDSVGNLFIADRNNNRIRKVDTSGIITTVAGNGYGRFYGDKGDDGIATDAFLNNPYSIAIDSAGNLLSTERYYSGIRKIYPSPLAIQFGLGLNSSDLYVPEKDGTAHIFSISGRHLRTVEHNTGKTLTTFNYDEASNLVAINDRFNNTITIERDSSGNPTAIVSPYGHRTALIMDSDRNLTDIRFEDSTGYSFTYSDGGLMTFMTNPRGLTSTHTFDSSGRVISTEDSEQGIWTFDRTAFADGAIESSVTSNEGNTTSHFETREAGGVYRSITTSPDGGIGTFVSKKQGLDVVTSRCDMTTEIHYTLDQRSKRAIPETFATLTPAGLNNQLTLAKTYINDPYDLPLTASTTMSQNGKTTSKVINYQTGEVTMSSPTGRIISSTYNPNTLLTTSTAVTGLLPTSFDYDGNGRLIAATTGDRSISYSYDDRGNLDSVIDPLGYTTNYTYDMLDRLTRIDRPDSSIVQFSYDEMGNMTMLTTPNYADNLFDYNGVKKLSKYTTPLNSVTTYSYDKERNLTNVSLPSGKEIINTYVHGRLSQQSTSEWTTNYNYFCQDLLSSITRGNEEISYEYDGTLLTSVSLSGALNQQFSFTYNNDFNVTSFSYGGTTENVSYDNDGLVIKSGRFSINRNVTNGLPVSVSDNTLNINRVFNGYGELQSASTVLSGSSVYSWDLSRNKNGQIVSKTEAVNGTSTKLAYMYDDAGRLTAVTKDGIEVEKYQYDANGNRLFETNTEKGIVNRSLTYSTEDHIINAGNISYEFDYDDNLSKKIDGTEVTNYEYSSTGELMMVTLPDGTKIEYVHDPLGRRIAKFVNGVITEKYLWKDLITLLAVYDGNGTLLQRYEYVDDRVPYAMTSNGNTYYLSYDQVGTLRLITDDSGNIVKQIDYDSFGNIIADSDPSFIIPFGFAGGLHDRDTGLVRFGYRDYMPEIGRWTAKDPILFAGGDANLYGYVQNDPINFLDSYGLKTNWKKVGLASAQIIGGVGTSVAGFVITAESAGIGGLLGGTALLSAGVSQITEGLMDISDAFNGHCDGGNGPFANMGSLAGEHGENIGKAIDTGLDIYSLSTGNPKSLPGAIDVGANAINVANDFGAFKK